MGEFIKELLKGAGSILGSESSVAEMPEVYYSNAQPGDGGIARDVVMVGMDLAGAVEAVSEKES